MAEVILENAMRVSVVLLAGWVVLGLARNQSAAFRHSVLSVTLAVSLLMPLLALSVPGWSWPAGSGTVSGTSVESAVAAMSVEVASSPALTWEVVGLGIWALGAMVVAASFLVGCGRLARIRRRSVLLDTVAWSRTLRDIVEAYGVRAPVRLVESRNPHLMTWGTIHPHVVVPRGARDWNEARIRAVLGHELAHIRRGDWAIQSLGECLRMLYWFNPLVWMACRQLRTEAERASDDMAIGQEDGAEYARHVVDLARLLRASSLPAVPFTWGVGSALRHRVDAMLDRDRDRRQTSQPVTAVIGVGFLLVGLAVAGCGSPRSAGPQDPGIGNATLVGTVVDQTGARVPGVAVSLTREDGVLENSDVTVISDQNGSYRLTGLLPGTYRASAVLPGFATSTFSDVEVRAGEELELPFRLAVSGGESRVRVREPRQGEEARLPGPTPAEPIRIGGQVSAGQVIRQSQPVYPEQLRRDGVEGVVILEATITTEGTVEDIRAIFGPRGLREAAEEAVSDWEYRPYLLNGSPVAVTTSIVVEFSLDDPD